MITKAGQAGAEQQQLAAVQQLTQNAAPLPEGCTHQLIILSNWSSSFISAGQIAEPQLDWTPYSAHANIPPD